MAGGFRGLIEEYISCAIEFIQFNERRPPPNTKDPKKQERLQDQRARALAHAKKVVSEGNALLAMIDHKRDVWIIVQLAFEFGKLHERWKVQELGRRSANNRSGAKKRNEPHENSAKSKHRKVSNWIEAELRRGETKRGIIKRAAERFGFSTRHIGRIRAAAAKRTPR